jgi:serine/threonine protein kinase
MGNQRGIDQPTWEVMLNEQSLLAASKYEAAWQQTLSGISQPTIDSYRAILRNHLEKLTEEYGQRLARLATARLGNPSDTQFVETVESQQTEILSAADLANAPRASKPDLQEGTVCLDPSEMARPDDGDTLHLEGPITPDVEARFRETPPPVEDTLPIEEPKAEDPGKTLDPSSPAAAGADTADFSLANLPGVNPAVTIDAPPAKRPHPGRLKSHVASDGRSIEVSVFDGEGSSGSAGWPTVTGYQILGELGRGGMGVVYKARQRGLNRLVALKMVLAGAHASAQQLSRFNIEAEAVARLQHPNIVQIYEVGEQEGLPFFSLEFVNGGPLDKKIAGMPQPVAEAAQMTEAMARAMHFAHEQGIAHRDLKPANILLTSDGIPKITDFGLAKRLEEIDSSQTRTGTIMGTPSYMAPEQARGEIHSVGPLSDLYTLGAILYELITGRPPFQGASAVETVMMVTSQETLPPSRLQPKTPRDLETICLKCLQKEPAKRYANCFELAEDLRRFQAGEPILARPIGQTERLWRWCKRNPRLAGMISTISILLVTGFVGSTWAAVTIRQERNQKETERQAAVTAREEADAARKLAQQNELVANSQAELSLETIGMLIKKVQRQLSKDPGMMSLKRDILQTAMDGLKRVANRAGMEGKMQRSMEDAYFRMGELATEFGESEEALGYFERRHAMTKDDLAAEPNNALLKERLAMACLSLGQFYTDVRREPKNSFEPYQECLKLRQQVAELTDAEIRRQNEELKPDERLQRLAIRLNLSEAHTRVGLTYYFLNEPAQAEPHLVSSLALREALLSELQVSEVCWSLIPNPLAPQTLLAIVAREQNQIEGIGEQRQNLARNYHLIAEIYFKLRNLQKSLAYYAKCAAVREAELAANPKDFRLKGDLGQFYEYYGNVHLQLGDPLEAVPFYDSAIRLIREVSELDKSVVFKHNLAIALYSRGLAAVRMNDVVGAESFFKDCLRIREELAAKDPTNYRRKINLMLVLPHCGKHVDAAQLAESLRDGREKNRDFLFDAAKCYAQCASASSKDAVLRPRYQQAALAALEACVAQGYKDSLTLETSPDLDPLRQTAEFKRLLQDVKSRAEAVTKAP